MEVYSYSLRIPASIQSNYRSEFLFAVETRRLFQFDFIVIIIMQMREILAKILTKPKSEV
jgi:hypothetical protein